MITQIELQNLTDQAQDETVISEAYNWVKSGAKSSRSIRLNYYAFAAGFGLSDEEYNAAFPDSAI